MENGQTTPLAAILEQERAVLADVERQREELRARASQLRAAAEEADRRVLILQGELQGLRHAIGLIESAIAESQAQPQPEPAPDGDRPVC